MSYNNNKNNLSHLNSREFKINIPITTIDKNNNTNNIIGNTIEKTIINQDFTFKQNFDLFSNPENTKKIIDFPKNSFIYSKINLGNFNNFEDFPYIKNPNNINYNSDNEFNNWLINQTNCLNMENNNLKKKWD